ncbi:MAG: hypothetical protein K6G01_05375 [Eubacterium sp.]|nr:hypothetical protein [Eubacterium sp.]
MGVEFKPSPKFLERVKLLDDTLHCRRTDHVLTAPFVMALPLNMYGGCNMHDAMMDYANCEEDYLKYHDEFQPDLAWGPQAIFPGCALEMLGCQYVKIPGVDIPDPNAGFQIVDKEEGFMEPEEYLEYAEDPTGFVMRKVLPRQFSALKGLEMVDFSNSIWQGALYSMIPCALPPVHAAFEALEAAGAKMMMTAESSGKLMMALAAHGFPSACDTAFLVPFDVFNDSLRGFMNTTMDMIEYPDELLAAVNASTKVQIRHIKNTFARQPFAKNVCFFVHNGFDMFMSVEQWQTFYWPGAKACIEAVIECGGTPHLYFEDKMDSKLEIIARDIPVGKCILTFINSDIELVKKHLTGKACLSGGVDGVLLQHGTKEEVIQNVKDAIDRWAPGGGYFLNCDVSLENAKPENLHALFDTAMSYMKY